MYEHKPQSAPYAKDEAARVLNLLHFDLDYSALEKEFEGLTSLAARVTGTEISLLNLIDFYTQWTVSGHGFSAFQVPREESVCQYTILEPDHFEVKNLQQDERFKNLAGIKDGLKLRYYLGVPLRTPDGHNIGALCVFDSHRKTLSPDKIDTLKTIANEIVKRLVLLKELITLRHELAEAKEVNKRVAHDIRGPIGGIMGLAQMLMHKEGRSNQQEVYSMSQMIYNSGESLLTLADEILQGKQAHSVQEAPEDGLTLHSFKKKLEELFLPQATNKIVDFEVTINESVSNITFTKYRLMQLVVNLVTNALKFTPPLGKVAVRLDITLSQDHRILYIAVQDTGIGLTKEQVETIMTGQVSSTTGTKGEHGYGMGLQLVRQLLNNLHGTMHIESTPGEGSLFELRIPIGMVSHIR